MTQKIAVAVVHGIGKQKQEFARALAADLKRKFAAAIDDPDGDQELQVRGVYWAEVIQDPEDVLDRMVDKMHLRWDEARYVMIDMAGDAIAYQPDEHGDRGTYVAVHKTFAGTLRALAKDAGPDAPLAIVCHSLGTVITSNYLWDLQNPKGIPDEVRAMMGDTALERGDTLTNLYTMGSPIAVWSLRFQDFGTPIGFPPDALPAGRKGSAEWVNLYDRDDVIAYPLKGLNDRYAAAVTEDVPVRVGAWWSGWTPASHTGYWRDGGVTNRLTEGLVRVWRAANPGS